MRSSRGKAPLRMTLALTGEILMSLENEGARGQWGGKCMTSSNFLGSKSGTEIQSTLQFRPLRISRAKFEPLITAIPKGLFWTMMVAMRRDFSGTWSTGNTKSDAPAVALSSAAGTKSAAKAAKLVNKIVKRKTPSTTVNVTYVFDITILTSPLLFFLL